MDTNFINLYFQSLKFINFLFLVFDFILKRYLIVSDHISYSRFSQFWLSTIMRSIYSSKEIRQYTFIDIVLFHLVIFRFILFNFTLNFKPLN